jgi:hypothetical protein
VFVVGCTAHTLYILLLFYIRPRTSPQRVCVELDLTSVLNIMYITNCISLLLADTAEGDAFIPRVQQFILGPHLSGAPIHFHCHAFNTVLHGRKRWLLIPPAQSFYSVVQAFDWLHEDDLSRYWDDGHGHSSRVEPHVEVDDSMLRHPEVSTCVQNAGEIFYVPSMWGHAVLNDGESVAVAVEFSANDC